MYMERDEGERKEWNQRASSCSWIVAYRSNVRFFCKEHNVRFFLIVAYRRSVRSPPRWHVRQTPQRYCDDGLHAGSLFYFLFFAFIFKGNVV